MTGDLQSTVIPPRGGMAWRLSAGQLLRIIDVEGSRSGDLFAVVADDLEDGQGMTFAAECDVFVAVTSCAAPGANAGGARPIRVGIGG